MKAYINYDPLLEAIEFKISTYCITHRVTDITNIIEVTNYKRGFLTMEVQRPDSWYERMQSHLHMLEECKNEEYIDFIEFLEVCIFSESFREAVIPMLENLKLEDIILERR